MSEGDDTLDAMEEGLNAVAKSAEIISNELRLMAQGKYGHKDIMFVSPRAKIILNTAADMIEPKKIM